MAARTVVRYCEEQHICRRVQLLRHFGEKFEARNCGGCDNCANGDQLISRDLTKEAQLAVTLVQSIYRDDKNMSLTQTVDIFRGAATKKVLRNKHDLRPEYGAGSALWREKILELLFDKLLGLEILEEKWVQVGSGRQKSHWYLKVSSFSNLI